MLPIAGEEVLLFPCSEGVCKWEREGEDVDNKDEEVEEKYFGGSFIIIGEVGVGEGGEGEVTGGW